MAPSPMQIVVAVVLAATVVSLWLFPGRDRWQSKLQERFILGVPWGSLIVVVVNVAFYLFAQSGLQQWGSPVIYAFVSWSYFYPLGVVTSGIAHGSPAHLVGNMAGTIVLAPIAEYAWGHYAHSERSSSAVDADEETDRNAEERHRDHESDEQTGFEWGTDSTATSAGGADEPWDTDDELLPDAPSNGTDRTIVEQPFLRAFVFFPGALLAISLITSVYSLGPSLGFSGAVYAIIGFAVVYYPLAAVVSVVAASGLGVIWQTVTNPIVRGSVEAGGPAPPSWAGIGFQAHALGFLLGVFAALALLSRRDRLPSPGRVFFGILGVGLAQSLWLVVWPGGDDVFVLYRAVGVVALFVVTALVTVAATSERTDQLLTKRTAAIGILAIATGLLAFPSIFLGIVAVDDGGVAGAQEVEIRDYTVAYADNVTSGHGTGFDLGLEDDALASQITGVVVTSEQRDVWTIGIREDQLAYAGKDSVVVGGPGWSETVDVERSGWIVAGNDTAFAVDLHHDGETTRSFSTDPSTADARIDGYTTTIVPTESAFELQVTDQSGTVDTIAIPEANTTTDLDGLRITTESDGDVRRIYMETDDGRALVATEETYS
ncbi:rhomboid family intramembrane serine protease [Salinarchaeum laminariae]|uniref:rhomboid family intramembrane serine protease n=1 Tax=Salinarchaeum laminariae TaxID=869888 RepID=UPI0020BF872A|nr:rhomboid family intramembrane serine protease [Salinarchaeum laminariae]